MKKLQALLLFCALMIVAGAAHAGSRIGEPQFQPEFNDIAVTAPKEGEAWQPGSPMIISWNYTGTPVQLKILLLKEGHAGPLGTIADNVSSASGQYLWPAVGVYQGGKAGPGSGYRIKVKVMGRKQSAVSGTFSIGKPLEVTAPNGGEQWPKGTKRTISWSYQAPRFGGDTTMIRLVLLQDGQPNRKIVELPASQGFYVWTVGEYEGGIADIGPEYRIKVSLIGTNEKDVTDAPFSITGLSSAQAVPFFTPNKPFWCGTDCTVVYEAVKRGLTFKVHATSPVNLSLHVSFHKPGSDGSIPQAKVKQSNGPTKDWTATFDQLVPNTLYYYVLRATDGAGNDTYKVGAAWTETVQYTVTLRSITLHDDTDDASGCECEFEVALVREGKPLLPLIKYGNRNDDDWISTGDTVYPNRQNVLKNLAGNPPTAVLHLVGADYDPHFATHTSEAASARKEFILHLDQTTTENTRVQQVGREMDFTMQLQFEPDYVRRKDVSLPDLSYLQQKK